MNSQRSQWGAKFITSLALVLAIGACASLALAADATPPATPNVPTTQPNAEAGHHKLIRDLIEGLGLTESTKAQIKADAESFGTALEAWIQQNGAQAKSLREQIKTARAAGDKATVKTLRGQLETLVATRPKLKGLFDQVRALLNPEQLAIFDKRVEEFRARIREFESGNPPASQPAPSSSSTVAPTKA